MNTLSNKKIKEDLISLYDSIFISDCFSTSDIIRYEMLLKEAEKRGLPIAQKIVEKENNYYDMPLI